MPYRCRVRRVDAQPTLSIRGQTTVSALPRTIGEYLTEVWTYLEAQGEMPAGPPFTRYHRIDGDLLELEAGFPTESVLAGTGRIRQGRLPEGDVVSTDHYGPYESLPEADDALAAWAERHGRVAAGPNWEVYWTDPDLEPDPRQWRTEVVKPLKA